MQRHDMQTVTRVQQAKRRLYRNGWWGDASGQAAIGIGLPLCGDFLTDDGDIDGGVADRVQGDARACLAAPFQYPGLGQSAQRAVHCGAGTAEFDRKIGLVRDHAAGGPIAGMDATQDFVLNGLPAVELRLTHSAPRSGLIALT